MVAFRSLELLNRPPYNCQSAGLDSSKGIELLIHISLNSESIYPPNHSTSYLNRSTSYLSESSTEPHRVSHFYSSENSPEKFPRQNRPQTPFLTEPTVSNRAPKMTLIQRLSLIGLIALIVSILLHLRIE